MSHGETTIYPILSELPKNLNGLKILDIGCGLGEVVYKIKAYSGFEWVHYSGIPYIVGIDINDKVLSRVKTFNIYDEVYYFNIEKGDIRSLGKYDIILINDCLEHTHLNSWFIEEVKNIGNKVIITVPSALTDSGAKDTGFPHVSVWKKEVFEAHGYKAKYYLTHPHLGKTLYKIFKLNKYIKGKNIHGYEKIIAVWELKKYE